jgi:integrase
MVRLQLLSGARPGEICSIRACDIDMTGRIWIFTPERHKGQHHSKARKVYFGPTAQSILREFLKTDLQAPLFTPIEAMEESNVGRRDRNAANRADRGTKLYPSQRRRIEAKRKKQRKRPIRDRYDVHSYRRAIKYAVRKANREGSKKGLPEVPDWHPHQLRHTCGTMLRRQFGLDAARAILGHTTPVVTEIYAEIDQDKALEIMAKIG